MPAALSKKQLLEENARLKQELELMRQKVDMLVRRIFGSSSEKVDHAQLDLFLLGTSDQAPGKADASSLEEAVPRQSKKVRERRERVPDDLPVEEIVIVPLEVQANPEGYRCIGQEVSEQLDYTPGAFRKIRTVRRKFVSREDREAAPLMAPLPPVLAERCTAAPGLLAAVVVGKFVDHLPFYRQETIFASRHRVFIPRQTMVRWTEMVADRLEPIYKLMRQEMVGGDYIQMDETPIRYLSPGHGATKLGYLWAAARPGADTIFHWETSRSAQCVGNLLPSGFQGILQTDAFSGYRSFASGKEERIRLAGCMAHARRKFFEARQQSPQIAGFILRQVRALYRIESQLRKDRAGPALRQAMRASGSRMIFERLGRLIVKLKTSGRFLPKSNMGKAIDYALSNWHLLAVFLEEGRVEIDTNRVENAIRPTAIGRKNWLFIGEAHAGQKTAILYTIVEACRKRGIDPFTYLRDVLQRLPSATNWTVAQLTPHNWIKARSSAPVQSLAA